MSKKFFKMCMVIGMIILLGTAGKADCNELMSFKQILCQSGIGLSLLLIGFVPLKISGNL